MCEACTVQKTKEQLQAEEQGKALEWARAYAWDWFEYHAGQRTSMFNYGIAAAAILAAGFGSSIEKEPGVAVAIGLVGIVVCLSFLRVDARNKFLVGRGEELLRAVEATLMPSVTVGTKEFKKPVGILTAITAADKDDGFFKEFWKGKHRVHMRFVQAVFMIAFALGAIGACQRMNQPEAPDKIALATTALATNVSSMARNVDALSTRLDKITSAIEADTRAREAAAKAQAAAAQRPKRSQGDK
ncbi:MAG TPA: hypothetical protein VJS12_23115 [Steroidobacteraceae bacterium]|nr:hypothetical protein [Steroidobacteraceae bacterium]